MNNLGDVLRKFRENKQLPLRVIAAYLDIDQAILSRIERGQRRASREQVVKLAKYFDVSETELLIAWLSDKVVYEIADEDVACVVVLFHKQNRLQWACSPEKINTFF